MNQDQAVYTTRYKAFHETNKEFDESMASLIEWLKSAVSNGYLAQKEALEIFNEELEKRRQLTGLKSE